MAGTLAYNKQFALNAICPYYTSFPLEFPVSILKKYQRHEIVLDPFCGRGTSIYAARERGLPSWGIDSSPIAVAISRAKLVVVNIDEVLNLASKFIETSVSAFPRTEFFDLAFEAETLNNICSIREGLMKIKNESNASVLLKAAMLGCLHGPVNKNTNELSYFSNQMPRTFSPKPNYATKFWKSRNLIAPRVNLLNVLSKKLKRLQQTIKTVSPFSNIITGDCTDSASYTAISENFSLIITSPPYYGMRTYVQDQWLRNWFLGGAETVDYKIKNQLDHGGQAAFIDSLSSVWRNVILSKSDSLNLHVRFGSLPSIKSCAKTIMLSSIEEATGWKTVKITNSNNHLGKRQAHQMQCKSNMTPEYDFHFVRI